LSRISVVVGTVGRSGIAGNVKLDKKLMNFKPAKAPVTVRADSATVGMP